MYLKNITHFFKASCLSLLVMCSGQLFAQAIKVEIIEQDGKFMMLRGGQAYYPMGVGMVDKDLQRVVDAGANSIRTWSVDSHALPAQELLDQAHALGLTVSLCLEFARERHGFDYNDEAAVAEQFERTRERVMKYKDHPALLTWIIGNEVNFDYQNPKVFDAINDVAKMIKEVDPNHPTTTALAGFDRRALKDIEQRAPDLDFVSFQVYADLINMPKYIKEAGYKKPYFITEWGAVGHWEVFQTKWGAPVEQTSSEKAANYAKSFVEVIAPYRHQAIGNYVFLWGQKQEKTSTWYGMFLDSGERTEAYDIMYRIWNGEWPSNRSPRISEIAIDEQRPYENVMLFSDEKYQAKVNVVEPDGDEVALRWKIRKESTSTNVGGDAEYVPPEIEGLITKTKGQSVEFRAPKEKGAYRLFAYAIDGKGSAAHANFPFYVK